MKCEPVFKPPWPAKTGRRALITGITGQDGSYLAELLLSKGYEVWGVIRRSSSITTWRIDHLYEPPWQQDRRLNLVYGDLNDASSLNRILKTVRPDEVYNLGAQSHVKVSFEIPEYTAEVVGVGAVRVLEAMRELDLDARFYQASSSELYGQALETPQTESTPFYPRSPYAAAKAYAFFITRTYREAYGMFAANGILFNHESPRRGETFVTRKITQAVARPDDFVVATGETHSVREFCELAFARVGLPLTWCGQGLDEQGLGPDGRCLVRVDPRYFRPAEVELLLGDATKARTRLGWEPTTRFAALVEMMVEADLKALATADRA